MRLAANWASVFWCPHIGPGAPPADKWRGKMQQHTVEAKWKVKRATGRRTHTRPVWGFSVCSRRWSHGPGAFTDHLLRHRPPALSFSSGQCFSLLSVCTVPSMLFSFFCALKQTRENVYQWAFLNNISSCLQVQWNTSHQPTVSFQTTGTCFISQDTGKIICVLQPLFKVKVKNRCLFKVCLEVLTVYLFSFCSVLHILNSEASTLKETAVKEDL